MTCVVPVAFHWSGGKDSAHALGRLLTDPRYEVRCLVTTVHASRDESTVHGVPTALLQAQARAVGLPLRTVELGGAGLDDYVAVMERASIRMRDEGIGAVGFGDQVHSGVLAYKQEQFGPLGLEIVEPLWAMSPAECLQDFLASGIRAVTVVVDAGVLDRGHLGRVVDRAFVDGLPAGSDPSGENGEYHSFVTDAPYFRHPVPVVAGEVEHIRRTIGTSDGPREYRYWRLHLRAGTASKTPGPSG